jgi:lipopolysaccharide export system protein LptA
LGNRARLVLRLLVLLPLIAFSAVQALAEDAYQRIEITAERMELNQNAEMITYIDDVTVRRGTMQITADRMRMDYRNMKLVRITAHGNPARYQQLLEADKGLMNANAHTIVYHTREELVDLEGDAHVRQGGNEITAEFIHYDVVAGRINAESGKDGRVIVTAQPPGLNK